MLTPLLHRQPVRMEACHCLDPYHLPLNTGGKSSACNAKEPSLILGSGRSPGEGNGNPLQHSFLENPVDRGAWQVTVHEFSRVRHELETEQQQQFVN